MKLKDILFMLLSVLILSTCAVIDPPDKLTQWHESRPNGQPVAHYYNDAFLHQNETAPQNVQ